MWCPPDNSVKIKLFSYKFQNRDRKIREDPSRHQVLEGSTLADLTLLLMLLVRQIKVASEGKHQNQSPHDYQEAKRLGMIGQCSRGNVLSHKRVNHTRPIWFLLKCHQQS